MVHNIVLSSMRYNLYIKKILFFYVKKKLSINQYLLLLSAITQMIFLNFKDYATINTTVELAKHKDIKVFPGFINAVLKNILKDKINIQNTEIEHKNLPKWFVEQTQHWNLKKKKLFVSSIRDRPNLHLVFKNENVIKNFNYKSFPTTNLSKIIDNKSLINNVSRYHDGEWWIQDFVTMLPIYLTPNLTGKNIIDMCAAPGGKSFQILSLNANLDIIEINKKRANIMKENLSRLRMSNKIQILDALNLNESKKYDVVLVDAPCTSVGTIRRNPEIFFRDSIPNFNKISILQEKLLNKAKQIVKSRGLIIYMVCSFLKFETIIQITNFLEKNSNFKIDKFNLDYEKTNLIDKNGFINTIPIEFKNFNIDGFFAARLIKND